MIDCTSSTTNIHQSPQNKTYMFGQPSDSSRWKETYGQAFYQKIIVNDHPKTSFGGIGICRDGFVAFSDGKDVRTDILGNWVSGNSEGCQRVFKGHDFVLVVVGGSFEDFCGSRVKADLDNLTKSKNYSIFDFLSQVVAERSNLIRTRTNQGLPGNDYMSSGASAIYVSSKVELSVGSWDVYGPYVQKITVNDNGVLLGERNRAEDLYLDGHKFYVDCSFVAFHPNADIEENKTLIKKSVEDFIEYVDDTFDSFNPVGGPVQCETLKFSEEVHDDK